MGCFFFVPFPGWSQLVEFVTNSTVLSFGSGPLVLPAMRRQRRVPGVVLHQPDHLLDRMGHRLVLVWFSGLAVISYLGNFPRPAKHAGNLDAIP